MIRTPAHKQTDPNKAPGMVRDNEGKVTFEEWYKKIVGISVEEARQRGIYSIDLMKQCWKEAQANK